MNVGAQARTGIKRDRDAHTCYMNAAIQMLYCMSTIRDHVSRMVDRGAKHTKSKEVVAAARVLDSIFKDLDARKTVGPLLSGKSKPKPKKRVVWTNRKQFDALNAGIPLGESPGVMADSSEFVMKLIDAILPEVKYAKGEYSNDNKECAIYEREFAECETKSGKTTKEVSVAVAYTLSGLLFGGYVFDYKKNKPVLVSLGEDGSVQDKIDAKRERTYPEPDEDEKGNTKPFEACKDGIYSRVIDFTTDSDSKYVVIPLSRGDNEDRNKAAVDPGRIELRSSDDEDTMHTYDLIGAILYHSYHYIFARTTGKHVDYIYDDDEVYKGIDARTYMNERRMSLAVDGVVFLYERIGTKVDARVETADTWDDSHTRRAIKNSTDHSGHFVVDLTASDDEDDDAKPNYVLLDFGSIVRQASEGRLLSLHKKYRTHRSQ